MSTSGIYDRFLRGEGKVKVFSTEEKARPIEVYKSLLRRSFPFVMASAMVLSSCCVNSVSGANYNAIQHNIETAISEGSQEFDLLYEKVVDYHKLNNLRDKVPLSDELVGEILSGENLPLLRDLNYNHMPENVDNFWEIVRHGARVCMEDVQNSYRLTSEQKSMYRIMANKMLSQISVVEGTETEIDLSDYRNLKSFMFFEKAIKYKDDYDAVIKQKVGVINEKTEIFGCNYEDFETFYRMASSYEDLVSFSRSLYLSSNKDKMLAIKDSALYNNESLNVLDRWMSEQNIEDDGLYRLSDINESTYCNSVAFYYKRGKDLRIKLDVDQNGDLGRGCYAPVGEIVIHELLHVMQRKPSSAEIPLDNQLSSGTVNDRRFEIYDDYIDEIGPTLMSITINDYLYKKAHNVEQNSVVDYGNIMVKGREIKIGELAMWFRGKLEEYKEHNEGVLSVDRLLSEPQTFNELKQIANGYIPNSNQVINQGLSLSSFDM